MKTAIIIPARYASTRFPGKPLALINGRAMIDHVHDLAVRASRNIKDVSIIVATDDNRIEDHCLSRSYSVLKTSSACKTGSDRVLEAAIKLPEEPDIVINLQGDAPLIPVEAIEKVIYCFANTPDTQAATPVKQLSWEELSRLRRRKRITPFSGTTAILGKHDKALWFSKMLIPLIRDEEKMLENDPVSPVYQHLGLYGYRLDTLKKFVNTPQGLYERLEGLEQLRFLENDIPIQCVRLSASALIHSGIDSPEDVDSVESLLRRSGLN